MVKKKNKSSAAEDLIESLMDDLKDLPEEGSIRFPSEVSISRAAPKNAVSDATNIWSNLEKNIESEDDSDSDHSEMIDLSRPGSFASSKDDSEGDEYLSHDASENELPAAFAAFLDLPSVGEESVYKGPAADEGYQNMQDLERSEKSEKRSESLQMTAPVGMKSSKSSDEKTVSILQDMNNTSSAASRVSGATSDIEQTLAVDGFANARLGGRKKSDVDVKVSVGQFRGARTGNVMTSVDASLAQAENLKLAQHRILELENEVEQLRADNEELASAGEIIRHRADQLTAKVSSLEREQKEIEESAESEIQVLKGSLQFKESELSKARGKVEELETRLKSDFKKIRVRERELENRLELLKAEKSALVRSKDEYILEQKRKIDRLSQELDNYRRKCLELNKAIEANQDQFKRTERALRLALTNLEAKEESLTPLKKAE